MKNFNYFTQDGNQYILDIQKKRWTIVTIIFLILAIASYLYFDNFFAVLFLCLGIFVALRLTKKVIFDTSKRAVIYRKSIFTGTETLLFDNFLDFSVTKAKEGVSSVTLSTDFEMLFECGDGRTRTVVLRKTTRNTKYTDILIEEVEWIMALNQPG